MQNPQLKQIIAHRVKILPLIIIILLLSLSSCSPQSLSSTERRAYDSNRLYNGEISYKVPRYWHKVAVSNPMRIDEYKIVSDKETAVLAIYVFPGKAGGIDSNLDRWIAQFQDDQTREVSPVEQFNLRELPVTSIAISGNYLKAQNPMDPSSPKTLIAKQKLLAAIVELRNEVYFFKLLGDADLVSAEKTNFEKLIDSFRLLLK